MVVKENVGSGPLKKNKLGGAIRSVLFEQET